LTITTARGVQQRSHGKIEGKGALPPSLTKAVNKGLGDEKGWRIEGERGGVVPVTKSTIDDRFLRKKKEGRRPKREIVKESHWTKKGEPQKKKKKKKEKKVGRKTDQMGKQAPTLGKATV